MQYSKNVSCFTMKLKSYDRNTLGLKQLTNHFKLYGDYAGTITNETGYTSAHTLHNCQIRTTATCGLHDEHQMTTTRAQIRRGYVHVRILAHRSFRI
jgi:hypothetical protein